MNSKRGKSRCGFTLIELTVVLILIVVMSAAAVLSLRPHLVNARLATLTDEVVSVDRVAREATRRTNTPVIAKFDLDEQTFAIHEHPRIRQARALRGVRIAAIQSALGKKERGQIEIPYTGNGQSPSFAILLTTSQQRRWLVVLGSTGQVTSLSSDSDVQQLLAMQSATTP